MPPKKRKATTKKKSTKPRKAAKRTAASRPRKPPPRPDRPRVLKVPGDGNCFFYSVYEAASKQGDLGNLLGCMFGERKMKRPEFVQRARALLADRFRDVTNKSENPAIVTLWNIKAWTAVDAEAREIVADAQDDWLAALIRSGAIDTVSDERFAAMYADHVAESCNYVSELEARTMQSLVNECLARDSALRPAPMLVFIDRNDLDSADCRNVNVSHRGIHYDAVVCWKD
jgi:hypothetical protein